MSIKPAVKEFDHLSSLPRRTKTGHDNPLSHWSELVKKKPFVLSYIGRRCKRHVTQVGEVAVSQG